MKTIITVILIIFVSAKVKADSKTENQCPTSNGYITTRVEASAKASFLHTVEHHWKFEFWRGAVCWGRPDDQYQDNQSFGTSSDQCVGSINFATNRGNQKNYTPMTLSWGANLTDEDTFTINLTDNRVQAVYDSSNSDCTSHRWGSKLEYASMTYETKAVINVPEDVWIVQVRAVADINNGSGAEDLHPRIGRQILKNENNPEAYLQSLTEREWTYLYVEPREALELVLSYANQRLSGQKKYNIRYDFKFIGHNRCVEVLGNPSEINYSPESMKKVMLSEVKSESDYHNYAVKLGCLRNPVFLKAAMNGSRPDVLVPTLKTLGQRTQDIVSQSLSSEKTSYASPFMMTILDMTMVDISRFALSDLLNYCKTYRDFTRESAINTKVTEVAGIEFMMLTYSHLEMIYSQLSRNALDVLVNNLEVWSKDKVTYAQLFDGNKSTQLALKAYQQSMVQMGLEIYSTMNKEISTRVPQVELAKNYREELLKDLAAAKTIANYLAVALRQTLRNFGNRSNNVVDATQIAAYVRQLSALDAKIHSEMKEYFKWFVSTSDGGDNGDRFVETLVKLQKSILAPSAENLVEISKIKNLKSLDEKFVRRSELNKLNQDIEKCIFQPYGGVQ